MRGGGKTQHDCCHFAGSNILQIARKLINAIQVYNIIIRPQILDTALPLLSVYSMVATRDSPCL